jgi:hypothetical protein
MQIYIHQITCRAQRRAQRRPSKSVSFQPGPNKSRRICGVFRFLRIISSAGNSNPIEYFKLRPVRKIKRWEIERPKDRIAEPPDYSIITRMHDYMT